jgi:hypothetical protein
VEKVSRGHAAAKGGMASSTTRLDPAQTHKAEGAEAKEDADALPLSRSHSSGQVQHGHGEARARFRLSRPTLSVEESAAQRDRLVADIAQLRSSDEAADWVHKNMPVKNELTAADADLVGAAFRDRLAVIDSETPALENRTYPVAGSGGTESNEPLPDFGGAPSAGLLEGPGIGWMVLHDHPEGRERSVAGKTIRLRDKEHCKYVATQPCLICGRTPSEAHHIRFAQPRALSRKVSDEYRFPSVGSITANCTVTGTKLHGGLALASTRCPSR